MSVSADVRDIHAITMLKLCTSGSDLQVACSRSVRAGIRPSQHRFDCSWGKTFLAVEVDAVYTHLAALHSCDCILAVRYLRVLSV